MLVRIVLSGEDTFEKNLMTSQIIGRRKKTPNWIRYDKNGESMDVLSKIK